MKKSEILNQLTEKRILSYGRIEGTDILVVFVNLLTWRDMNVKFIKCIIDIQPWGKDSFRISFDIDEWDDI